MVDTPANDARLATDAATLPFWAESAMPFTSRTVAIAYSMHNMFSDAAASLLFVVTSPRCRPMSLQRLTHCQVVIAASKRNQVPQRAKSSQEQRHSGTSAQHGPTKLLNLGHFTWRESPAAMP